MTKILFKLASRSRHEKMFSCIENIIDKCESDDYSILLTVDENDRITNTPENRTRIEDYGSRVIADWGQSMSKIHAINRGVPVGWDIIVATSDDILFTEYGFDNIIREDMPESLDAVLHYPDGFEHGDILTMPVMGRKYYDRDKFIYNPAYISLFCDEEALIVANHRKCLVKSKSQFYKHMHPAWTGGPMDKQLEYTQRFYATDKKTFFKRKARNFNL